MRLQNVAVPKKLGNDSRSEARHRHPRGRMAKVVDYYFTPVSPWSLPRPRSLRRHRQAPRRVGQRQAGRSGQGLSGLGRPAAQAARAAAAGVSAGRAGALEGSISGVPINVQPAVLSRVRRSRGAMDPAAGESGGGADAGAHRRVLTRGLGRRSATSPTPRRSSRSQLSRGSTRKRWHSGAATEATKARYDGADTGGDRAQVFGAPTYIYRDEPFWGQDRLDFLDRALAK